jgi:hypothetical protein
MAKPSLTAHCPQAIQPRRRGSLGSHQTRYAKRFRGFTHLVIKSDELKFGDNSENTIAHKKMTGIGSA